LLVPSNADAIVLQWLHLHSLEAKPDRLDTVEGHPRRTWMDAEGTPLIEQNAITGMGHGVPLDGGGEDRLGSAGPHMPRRRVKLDRHDRGLLRDRAGRVEGEAAAGAGARHGLSSDPGEAGAGDWPASRDRDGA
jgi:hypothetical protein